jgi:hypothetical protein
MEVTRLITEFGVTRFGSTRDDSGAKKGVDIIPEAAKHRSRANFMFEVY